MSTGNADEANLRERRSASALLVLGMHRSGTSAITGALRLCGAWPGDEADLTEANAENPSGFWERRDVRQVCDRLLQSAGADWWKISSFEPDAIPHAILIEQRRKFAEIVSELGQRAAWVVKEPRLCLLLPALRDQIANPVCILIYRNPLEVARSLQARNGFGISAGLALWEAYNRRALSASENLPRVLVSHEALMLHPVGTVDGLLKGLGELAVANLERPDEDLLTSFINPVLYRRRATDEETEEFLSPPQRMLWQMLSSEQVRHDSEFAVLSRVARQNLLNLESTERSLEHHKERRDELVDELRRRQESLSARGEAIRDMQSRTKELRAELAGRTEERKAERARRTEELRAERARGTETLREREAEIRDLKSGTNKLREELAGRTEELKAERARGTEELRNEPEGLREREAEIRDLESGTNKLRELAGRTEELREREAEFRDLESGTNKLREELAGRTEELREREAEFRDLESGTNKLREELAGRTEELKAERARGTEELRAERARGTETLREREAEIRDLESGTNKLREELAGRTETLREREAEFRDLKSGTNKLRAELAGRTEELKAERARRTEELRAERARGTETLRERQEEIRDLKSGTNKLRAEIARRAETINTRNRTVGGLKTWTKELRAEIGRRTATIRELSGTIDRLRGQTVESNAEVSRQTKNVKIRDKTIGALIHRTEAMNDRLRAHRETIKARDDAVRSLNGRMETLTEVARRRSATIKARDDAVRSLNGRMETLTEVARRRSATIKARDDAVRSLNGRMETLREVARRRSATIKARDDAIRSLRSRMETLREGARKRSATIKARDAEIRALLGSHSWRIAAPLRAMSRGGRFVLKNARRTLKLLFWLSTGQLSRSNAAVRHVLEQRGGQAPESRRAQDRARDGRNPDKRASTKGSDTGRRPRRTGANLQRHATSASEKQQRTKVTVVAWDVGHNPLGRAYLIADMLRNTYDVELVGANFPRFGSEIWKPLRNSSRVPIRKFPGANFPDHFQTMDDIARGIAGDIVIVSKPRLPSIELAVLAKLHRNRPLILDIDDYELGFFKNRKPLSLPAVQAHRRNLDFDCPHDETWTRYSESLVPLFDQVTVSNPALQEKFGGFVLPHVRSETDFDPTAYDRDAIRQALGFTPDDRVIVFAGTPRMHKGVARIVRALRNLDKGNYKLMIVGSSADSESRHFLQSVNDEFITVLPDVQFSELPRHIAVADLICLLQDRRKVTSSYQMPAKFTDGLAMGIPMLASNVSPLEQVASRGLVNLVGDMPLQKRIDDIFTDYGQYKDAALKNREVFGREYSYGANLPGMKACIDRLLANPSPAPGAFHELVEYHRSVYPGSERSGEGAPKVETISACGDDVTVTAGNSNSRWSDRKLGREREYADDGLDVVFFWKQNDTGIYGRRQDMLVKYLAREPRIRRILHFDAPMNLLESGLKAVRNGAVGRRSQARWILGKTLRRKLGSEGNGKIRFDTFTYSTNRKLASPLGRVVRSREDYADYLEGIFAKWKIGGRRTLFWVCPNDFHFPEIAKRFEPDLVVADVIDDQRSWPVSDRYRRALTENYETILKNSDLVFVNCRSVLENMKDYSNEIHLLPNAAEVFEDDVVRAWEKPVELRNLEGPIVGYVGNLDGGRIDVELLLQVVRARPQWNWVFIGSTHMGGDIWKLKKFANVHLLGVRIYEDAIRYIRFFDVAVIPHLDNEMTRNMNPLKLYVYLALQVPVVATQIENIDDFGDCVRVGGTPEEFMNEIRRCVEWRKKRKIAYGRD